MASQKHSFVYARKSSTLPLVPENTTLDFRTTRSPTYSNP